MKKTPNLLQNTVVPPNSRLTGFRKNREIGNSRIRRQIPRSCALDKILSYLTLLKKI